MDALESVAGGATPIKKQNKTQHPKTSHTPSTQLSTRATADPEWKTYVSSPRIKRRVRAIKSGAHREKETQRPRGRGPPEGGGAEIFKGRRAGPLEAEKRLQGQASGGRAGRKEKCGVRKK